MLRDKIKRAIQDGEGEDWIGGPDGSYSVASFDADLATNSVMEIIDKILSTERLERLLQEKLVTKWAEGFFFLLFDRVIEGIQNVDDIT